MKCYGGSDRKFLLILKPRRNIREKKIDRFESFVDFGLTKTRSLMDLGLDGRTGLFYYSLLVNLTQNQNGGSQIKLKK